MDLVQDLRGDSLKNTECMPINRRSYGSEFYAKLGSPLGVRQRDFTGSTRFLVCLGEIELGKKQGTSNKRPKNVLMVRGILLHLQGVCVWM